MNAVYLVLCGWDYDGESVKALLTSKDEAESVAEKYRDKELFSFDTVKVEKWNVGEVTDRRWE